MERKEIYFNSYNYEYYFGVNFNEIKVIQSNEKKINIREVRIYIIKQYYKTIKIFKQLHYTVVT